MYDVDEVLHNVERVIKEERDRYLNRIRAVRKITHAAIEGLMLAGWKEPGIRHLPTPYEKFESVTLTWDACDVRMTVHEDRVCLQHGGYPDIDRVRTFHLLIDSPEDLAASDLDDLIKNISEEARHWLEEPWAWSVKQGSKSSG